MGSPGQRVANVRYWWPLLPVAALLIAHSLYFDFLTDDSFISFVYARNFAEHNQLVFNPGERVEGYTNFLWTLLLGSLMKLGIQPEWSSRVLGTAFGVATLFLVVRLSAAVRGRRSAWNYLPALLLAVSSGYACWCSGGLETQMFTFFVALALLFYQRESLVQAGWALALAALTRPEGVLVLAVVVLHRVATNLLSERRLRPVRAEWLAAAVFLAIFVPYFAWRWWYYGWPFPNTYYVKMGSNLAAGYERRVWAYGGYYVWQWATQSGAIFALPLAIVATLRHRRFASLVLSLSAVYLLYTAKAGGDFMGLHRFVMPLFVVVALLAALGLAVAVSWLPKTARRWVGVLCAAALVGGFGWSQARLSRASMVPKADHGIDRPGYLKLYTHDRALMGKALRPHIEPEDFSIVGGAGVQTYYARMRAIDVFGLVSDTIAHDVSPHNPRPGHQKWAPARLLLQFRPTFLFHCYDLHHHPKRYRLCGEARYFINVGGYEPVTIRIPGLKERGQYYTFLKHRSRKWQLPPPVNRL